MNGKLVASYPTKGLATVSMWKYARRLISLGLANEYGVFVKPIPGTRYWGIYVGPHSEN